jgi:hypothetical protein
VHSGKNETVLIRLSNRLFLIDGVRRRWIYDMSRSVRDLIRYLCIRVDMCVCARVYARACECLAVVVRVCIFHDVTIQHAVRCDARAIYVHGVTLCHAYVVHRCS